MSSPGNPGSWPFSREKDRMRAEKTGGDGGRIPVNFLF